MRYSKHFISNMPFQKSYCLVFILKVVLLFIGLNIGTLNAQVVKDEFVISNSSYAEKIYLQLSSTVVTNDETIWLKAIVTDAVNHIPSKLSEALHVELIDFDERVIDKKLLKMQSGIAHTSFQLNESCTPGRYLIRAYTKWNKNFGADFISEQYIDVFAFQDEKVNTKAIRNITLSENGTDQFELSAQVFPKVINPKHKGKLKLDIHMGFKKDSVTIKKNREGLYQFNYLLPKDVVKTKLELKLNSIKLKNNELGSLNRHSQTIVINKNYFDLQFFPEGGKLVNGLPIKVGFKALDYNNKGKKVKGYIIDDLGNKLLPFISNDLGMGSFGFIPNIDKQYFGQVEGDEGVKYKYLLPKISKTGSVLSIKPFKQYVSITVTTNHMFNDSLAIKTSCRGIKYHYTDLKFKGDKVDIFLEKKSLPKGIIVFTVLDKNNQPILERLFFNYREDAKMNIRASTNLKTYDQRDKTIVNIKTNDSVKPEESTNLSVLVLNRETLGDMHQKRNNIQSYFLLDSELRGKIEIPFFYFNTMNADRYRDMDALMLSQGWRNYKYKREKPSLIFKHNPEKGIMVTGTVGEYFNPKKRPKQPLELTLMTFGKPQSVYAQEVDSTGHFNFNLGDVYSNELEILIQSKTAKDKKKDYTINIDKKKPPSVQFNKEEKIQFADTVNVYVEKSSERKQIEDEFRVSSNTITLDEVNISGYKMTPEREKMMELHGVPDVVIEDKQLHKKIKKWSYGLFSVLLFNYPEDVNVRRVGSNGGFLLAEVYGADFTFILIDGIPVLLEDYPLIGHLPTEEIKSVEILNSPKNSRKYVSLLWPDPMSRPIFLTISIINIYTYSKQGLFGVQRTSGITKTSISGFTPTREFYTPKYEDLTSEDWRVPDLRSIVYWNPSVQTDTNGNAKVEFYNPDNTGDMLVIIEGINKNGNLGYYEMIYEVEEKLVK